MEFKILSYTRRALQNSSQDTGGSRFSGQDAPRCAGVIAGSRGKAFQGARWAGQNKLIRQLRRSIKHLRFRILKVYLAGGCVAGGLYSLP